MAGISIGTYEPGAAYIGASIGAGAPYVGMRDGVAVGPAYIMGC